jgi:hypothetical protein
MRLRKHAVWVLVLMAVSACSSAPNAEESRGATTSHLDGDDDDDNTTGDDDDNATGDDDDNATGDDDDNATGDDDDNATGDDDDNGGGDDDDDFANTKGQGTGDDLGHQLGVDDIGTGKSPEGDTSPPAPQKGLTPGQQQDLFFCRMIWGGC